jgi:RimJ/RimL family protein N-acetyltransferase
MRPDALRPPVSLRGRRVTLRPLASGDAPALLRAARDPEVSRYLFHPPGATLAETEAYVAWLLALQSAGSVLALVVEETGTGAVLGATRYHNIDRENDSVEIGTWLDATHWRTGANTEAKWLMLRHAFESAGVHRVSLLTDLRNERSQAAIARLGAVREGVLRGDRKRPDGSHGSSVVYSILADEWPRARARLLARLEDAPPSSER